MTKIYIFLIAGISIMGGFIIFLLLKPAPKVLSISYPAETPNFFATEKPADNQTNIIAIGDIMLGRSVMSISLSKKDPTYPFEKVAEKLRLGDLVLGNLENPIIKDCPFSNSGFKFCADPEMIKGLVFSGIDVVNLANNHTLNYGIDGFSQTKEFLKNSGVEYVGDGNLVIKNINGTNFGFLGFDYVDKIPSEPDLELINNSKERVGVLMVMVHWGVEYTTEPTHTQKSIAKNLTDSGADVIIGSHPHWIQTIDNIEGKPVLYSLGNFVFDQSFEEQTKSGLAVNLIYSGKILEQIEKMPVYMSNFAQPEWR